jgi:asparagine synthase (glutamine-hydrolysing)
MCGINGIFAYHYAANPIDEAELVRTRDRMAARGPDGEGLWISEDRRIGLGHRRLSIIDPSEAGAQPMVSRDGRYAVTFNGEIYNYRELRSELERRGSVFSSQSDTEVLLHLYTGKGAAMVEDLRGMYAFSIWDEERRSLFLARDPYGVKPLYYADDGWTFRFASQVKALLAGRAVSRDTEPAGLVGYHLFGNVPEPFTLYREIRALPAGTTLFVSRTGHEEPRRYHSIAQVYTQAELEAKKAPTALAPEAGEEVREALLDSVRHHLVADVPVGAFLSSGIDSSVLVSLMRNAGHNELQTVTLAFNEFDGCAGNEAPLASKIATLYGTKHFTRIVTQKEFFEDLPRIFDAMDQPSIDGVNTWFAAKAARETGLKVAISGLGGDELFGGYPSFRQIPRWVRLFAVPSRIPFLGAISRRAGQILTSALCTNPKAAGMAELGGSYAGAYLLRRGLFMPWELETVLDKETVREGLRRLSPLQLVREEITPPPRSPFAKISALESSLYMRNQLLRDTDWASMAHGLEVRVPLVDSVLLSRMALLLAALRQRSASGKALLAAAATPSLPAEITLRAKSGFTTPVAAWQRRPLSPLAAQPSEPASIPWARSWARAVIGQDGFACASLLS